MKFQSVNTSTLIGSTTTYKFLFALALLFFCETGLAQFEIPPLPKEQTSVYDYVNLLSSTQKNSLEKKLIEYSDLTSTQIVVAIIASTKGEEINFLGAKWGHAWGIGQEKKDNGILILLARDDRRIGINTGYGIEPLLTDALSKRIIERDIIPEFKKGDYYSGLDVGVNSIFEVLTGAYTEDRDLTNQDTFPVKQLFFIIIIFLLILIIISSKRNGGGNRGRRTKGSSLLDVIILSNVGRTGGSSSSGGSFGGGSFGGGGFGGGGFGGGGFGGGGASGGW